ncbi:hypothetical protein ONZ45_g17923 [Pleurotus djamor]|nr:hypothetical protein ONZ45_g17923 [Pleurotus djamor]
MIPSLQFAVYAFLSLQVFISSLLQLDLSPARYKSPLDFLLGSPPPPLTLDSGRHFARPLLLDPPNYSFLEDDSQDSLEVSGELGAFGDISHNLTAHTEAEASAHRNAKAGADEEVGAIDYIGFMICLLAGFVFTGVIRASPTTEQATLGSNDVCEYQKLDCDAKLLENHEIATSLGVSLVGGCKDFDSTPSEPMPIGSLDINDTGERLDKYISLGSSPDLVNSLNTVDSDVFLTSKTFVDDASKSFFDKGNAFIPASRPSPLDTYLATGHGLDLSNSDWARHPLNLPNVPCPFEFTINSPQVDVSFECVDDSPALPSHVSGASRFLTPSMHATQDMLHPQSIPWGDSILFGSHLELDFFLPSIRSARQLGSSGTHRGACSPHSGAHLYPSSTHGSPTFSNDNLQKAQEFWDDPSHCLPALPIYAYTPHQSPTYNKSFATVPSLGSLSGHPMITVSSVADSDAELVKCTGRPTEVGSAPKRHRSISTQTQFRDDEYHLRSDGSMLFKRGRLAEEQADSRQTTMLPLYLTTPDADADLQAHNRRLRDLAAPTLDRTS